MKTIEERAKEYGSKKGDISLSSVYNEALANIYKEGYIAGATEQKAIDEAIRLKKCDDMTEAEYNREVAFLDWFYENSGGTITHSDAIEWARREVIEKFREWLKNNWREYVYQDEDGIIHFGHWESDFRKVMEE